MMLSKKSSSRRMWKLAYVLPLMCGAMAAFAEERTVFIEPTPAQQDKVTESIAKSETIGQENLAEDKKTTVISIQNDTTTKADTIEYYINGRIATDEEVKNLDSATIIHMNINKNNETKRIDITTKGAEEKVMMINIDKKERPVVIMEGGVRTTHRDIYIDGKKVSQEEMNELSAERIINVDVKDDRIDITTKKEGEGIPETKGKIIRIATADELYDISELLKNKEQFIYYEIPENVAEKMNEMTAQLKTTTMPDTDTQRLMEDIQAAMAGLDAMSADMAAFSADFEAIKSQTLADWAKMAENGEIDKSQVDDVRTNIATNEKQFKKMKREFEREAKKAKKRLEKYQAELDE